MSVKSSMISFSTLFALMGVGIAEARPYQPTYQPTYYGSVYVTNQTVATLYVTVDGQAVPVGAGRTQSFQTRAGDVAVRATYRQFGVERSLASRSVYVRPSRASAVVLTSPSTGYVKVENEADRSADLIVDGRVLTSFAPYQTRLIAMPVGCHDLAMVAGSWTIDRQRLEVGAFGEPTFEAQMPHFNDLVVMNPLPIPIQLVTDRGMVRTVEARSQTVYDDVAIGSFHVSARRVTGERVDDIVATVRPDMVETVRIDPPSAGLVDVRNEAPVPTRLIVDGRTFRSLAADQDTRIELSLGQHHVEVIDDRGRRVTDTWVCVEPYDVSRIYVGPREVSHNDGDSHHRSDAERASVDEDRWDRESDESNESGRHH